MDLGRWRLGQLAGYLLPQVRGMQVVTYSRECEFKAQKSFLMVTCGMQSEMES